MWSVFSRCRLASQARTMWCRERPPSLGPGPMSPRTFVAIRTSSRSLPSASPRICSDRPSEYTSAVSNRLTPASRASAIWWRAPSTSIRPTGLAQPVPPNPIVPSVIVEIRRPDRPSCLYSMPRAYDSRRRRAGWLVPAQLRRDELEQLVAAQGQVEQAELDPTAPVVVVRGEPDDLPGVRPEPDRHRPG